MNTTTNATTSVAYRVNIPSVGGGNTAFAGFIAGTGSESSIQNILDWTYSNHKRLVRFDLP